MSDNSSKDDVPPLESRLREHRQKDLDHANAFRIEGIKHLISISTAVFAFTVVFVKDFAGVKASAAKSIDLVGVAWFSLIISILAGVLQLRYWAWFFTSWAKQPDVEEGLAWRSYIDTLRKVVDSIQIGAFVFGIVLLAVFASRNF